MKNELEFENDEPKDDSELISLNYFTRLLVSTLRTSIGDIQMPDEGNWL